ncbi:hypothetical protein O6H91_02G029100 [Diphasiastrum complanatum]|uniref:Uncharacterized protein n=1 Tax=Diphasiastrum complanatum TaxID=34168 RepID=A0ACC2EE28_DIPCM|nr:hypothetical protein O6H91_02G029100 [Diphasiastrum complanatum]
MSGHHQKRTMPQMAHPYEKRTTSHVHSNYHKERAVLRSWSDILGGVFIAWMLNAKEYPYFPGQETTLIGSSDDLLKSMEEAGVDGALIVQPINYMFDHSYVTSVLQKHPDKFLGCFLADPSDGGNGIAKLEHLVTKEGYKAMRFNPYLWPPNEKMNNEIGRKLFAKAGELGIAVGFMCFKVQIEPYMIFFFQEKCVE